MRLGLGGRLRSQSGAVWLARRSGGAVWLARRSGGAVWLARRSGGAVWLALVLASSWARAQDDEARVPPRVVELGAIEVPAGASAGPWTVVVRIDVEGHAEVESCEHEEDVCAAARAVVEAGVFEPARVRGEIVEARVRVTLHAVQAETTTEAAPTEAAPTEAAPSENQAPVEAAPEPASPSFRARARIEPMPAGTRRFELVEIRDVPGAMGDSFRALDTMPGVVPVASGAPYSYIRGSPPAGSLYVYDGLPLPMLFHLGIGPAVIHPRMLGPVRLHAGVAPTRYGRHVGGVLVGEGPTASIDRPEVEAELRLLDLNAYAHTPVLGGHVAGAVRVGYPGLLMSAIVENVDLQYWDYQLRGALPLSSRDELSLVWIGSFDRLVLTNETWIGEGEPVQRDDTITTIQFHRGELRYVHRQSRAELGVALRVGFEETSLSDTREDSFRLAIAALTIGPRIWGSVREGWLTLRMGGDAIASFGRPSIGAGSPSDNLFAHEDLFTSAGTRSTSGAYAEVVLDPDPLWSLELGARFDVWITAPDFVEGALDPRGRFTLHVHPEIDLHAAIGVVRQPATFFIPLPGVADVPLARGLQTAVQAELGVHWQHELVEVELQGFAHRYDGLLFPDFFVLAQSGTEVCERPGGGCQRLEALPRIASTSWGGELFVRLPPTLPVHGWVSYTLAWAELDPVALGAGTEIDFRPSYDIRHVLNIVATWNVVGGFTVGGRLLVRSGGPRGQFWRDASGGLSYTSRELDAFARLDVQLAYAWDAGWGRLRVSLDWFNVTFAQEPFALSCETPDGMAPTNCRQSFAPPIVAPNLGLRMEL